MTLSELTEALRAAPPDAALIFEAPSGRTGSGYHVTEFKRADIVSVDCGGTRDAWQEVTLQIQDGQRQAHMQVGKFLSIADRSAAAIDGLGHGRLRVEFAAGNARLELLSVGVPTIEGGAVVVPLGEDRAVCKPLQRAMAGAGTSSCCGAAALQHCCAAGE